MRLLKQVVAMRRGPMDRARAPREILHWVRDDENLEQP